MSALPALSEMKKNKNSEYFILRFWLWMEIIGKKYLYRGMKLIVQDTRMSRSVCNCWKRFNKTAPSRARQNGIGGGPGEARGGCIVMIMITMMKVITIEKS